MKKLIIPEKAERIMIGIYTMKDGRRLIAGKPLGKHGRKWEDVLCDAFDVLYENGGKAFDIGGGRPEGMEDWMAIPFGGDMKARLMALYKKQDWKGIVETMAKNPGDKGDVVSMLDSYGENVDYVEAV